MSNNGVFQGRVCSSRRESQGVVGYLDKSEIPRQTSADAHSTTFSHCDDRRLLGRLVWDPSSSKGHGFLGSRRLPFLNELEGIKGYSSVSDRISVSPERESSAFTVGQHHGHLMPSSSRFSEICAPAQPLSGNIGVLQETVDLPSPRTSKGSFKRSGRPGVPAPSNFNRMVTGQDDVRLDLRPNFPLSSGSIRNQGQYSVGSLCVSLPRRPCGGVQRFQLELGSLDLHLPISSFELLSRCGVPSSGVQRERCPDSSLLALERVVPSALPALQRGSPSPTREFFSGTSNLDGFSSSRQPVLLEASPLDSLSSPWVSKGLSGDSVNIVNNAHRVGTRRQYQSIWTKFLDFLSLNRIPHGNITVFCCNEFSFLSLSHFR